MTWEICESNTHSVLAELQSVHIPSLFMPELAQCNQDLMPRDLSEARWCVFSYQADTSHMHYATTNVAGQSWNKMIQSQWNHLPLLRLALRLPFAADLTHLCTHTASAGVASQWLKHNIAELTCVVFLSMHHKWCYGPVVTQKRPSNCV